MEGRFNGGRLAIARQRNGLTKKELALKIGVDPRAISGFEASEYDPFPENVQRMANALRYPVAYFYGDDLEVPDPTGVSFRSMSKMSARQRDAAIAAGAIAFAVGEWVENRFNLPSPDLMDLRGISPEMAAMSLRQYWGLGALPVKNIVHLLEAKGVRVFSLAENCRELDAYSVWRDGRPYAFINITKSSERRRYDLSHELGHLVLHKHASPNGLEAEKEANAFASAFLMPADSIKSIGKIPASLDLIMQLKKRWIVSAAAMTYRLHELSLLSDWNHRALFIEMQRRGYLQNEPNESRAETSQVWQKVFAALRDDGLGLESIADDLQLPTDEVVKLVFGLVTIGLPSLGAGIGSANRKPPALKLVN
jgi:Zn-dependent peptidase ImmA (M78 family)/transcriptional regulator with XRE-family HTH domain